MTRLITFLIACLLAVYAPLAASAGQQQPARSQAVTISISLMILPDPAEQQLAARDCATRWQNSDSRTWQCTRGDRSFRTVRNEDDVTVVISPI